MSAAKYADAWPPAPDGRFRVACYVGNFADSPVIYERAAWRRSSLGESVAFRVSTRFIS